MNAWTIAATAAGGVGLFLLGMSMMTDGLKLAAGPALERILGGATRTRGHALASGALVTAVVQSSSAVTVATIGFVNAGLMTLAPALWVLFGANVGTTMTGWLVALVGLKFKIEALALPMIGIGVVFRLTGEGTRRGALGSAGAGLGLLFLGIAMLQQAFGGLAETVHPPTGEGPLAALAQLGIGAVLTVLMQSSSASMTVALTAAQGGLLTPQGAAAMVIGANIGTTVKAMLAAIGATPNARRAAAAHVIFNALTGVVALLLLPWLIDAIAALRAWLGLPADAAAKLALFHTIFNVLGVLLMWPLAARLTRWLQGRFRAREEDEAQPRHLDDNALAVPALAVEALAREVDRIGHAAVRMARAALAGAEAGPLARDDLVVGRLAEAADRFAERVNRGAMTRESSARLAATLRVQRYHRSTAEQALLAAAIPVPALPAAAAPEWQAFVQRADALLALCDPLAAPATPPTAGEVAAAPAREVAAALATAESAYQALKATLLAAAAGGGMAIAPMEAALRRLSALRRAMQQAAKAHQHRHDAYAHLHERDDPAD